MKSTESYCPHCCKQTTHVIWTEDGYGAEGISRIFTSILSLGMSNIACTTYCKCLVCETVTEIMDG